MALSAAAIALETSVYADFEDFIGRLEQLLKESASIIDSDFYTRIGLRYINSIPIEEGDPSDWINHDLIPPPDRWLYGAVSKYRGEVRGRTDVGLYSFRHGLEGSERNPVYHLDFDFFAENVQAEDAIDLLRQFNLRNFSFFDWCLGEKARVWLGPGSPKSEDK